MKKILFLFLTIIAFGANVSADETIVKEFADGTLVRTRWSEGVSNTREDGFVNSMPFYLTYFKYKDGKTVYRFTPLFFLWWYNDGDYKDTNFTIGKDDNCLVKLKDGTILELDNCMEDKVFTGTDRAKFQKISPFYDKSKGRTRAAGGCLYFVDYTLTPEQYQQILAQGITRLRIEYDGGFLTLDINNDEFLANFRLLNKEIERALSGDNILNDF